MEKIDLENLKLTEQIIKVKRVAKVIKGGRRFSFSALVAVGDGAGHVGIGLGKAREVTNAVQKAVEQAKKNIFRVPLKGTTIPHEVIAKYGAAKVLLKPASPGTGVIAGNVMRAILECAGIKDILTKVLRSNNAINIARATVLGLQKMRDAETVAALRGRPIE